MINRDPVNVKNVGKMRRGVALKTQDNTMSTLSDTMMMAMFMHPLKQMDGFVA
jgi:hypothetical protein